MLKLDTGVLVYCSSLCQTASYHLEICSSWYYIYSRIMYELYEYKYENYIIIVDISLWFHHKIHH